MMKTINKDILTVKEGVICQQVNCAFKMGSGLAKAIKEKWPVVETAYQEWNDLSEPFLNLGRVQYIKVGHNLHVCNIFGQLTLGRTGRHTDYCALKCAFSELQGEASRNAYRHFYFPYKFGCGTGGGDWEIVSKMLEYWLPQAIICKV